MFFLRAREKRDRKLKPPCETMTKLVMEGSGRARSVLYKKDIYIYTYIYSVERVLVPWYIDVFGYQSSRILVESGLIDIIMGNTK